MSERLPHLSLLLALLVAGSSCGKVDPGGEPSASCRVKGFPEAPATATFIVHVAGSCPESGDGSREHPYRSIQQALSSSPPPEAILVAPGVYEEGLKIEVSTAILGGVDPSIPEGAVLRPPSQVGIEVTPPENAQVTLEGLTIQDTRGLGLVHLKGKLSLKNITIQDTHPGELEATGHGVVLYGGELDAERLSVERSAQVGVLLASGKATLSRARIAENRLGGLRAQKLDGPLTILDSEILDNQQVGVGLFAGTALLRGNKIARTGSTPDGIGDGVIVNQLAGATETIEIYLEENSIERSARVGVLLGAGSRGTLRSNTILDSVVKSAVGAGIWLQAQAGGEEGIRLEANRIEQSRLLGLCVTSGSRVMALDNTITRVAGVSIPTNDGAVAEIGDGVGAFLGASVLLENNTIRECSRAGLFFDAVDASSSRTSGNKILANSTAGAIVQRTEDPEKIDIHDNLYEGNGTDVPVVLGPGDPPFPSPQPTALTD